VVIDNGPLDTPGGPAVDPATAHFIAGLYGALLGRPPDVTGQANLADLLHDGIPARQAARAVWQSAEHRGRQVDQYYLTFLHRQAEPAERALWVNYFLTGASELAVEQSILTSGEYQAARTDTTSFVRGLYTDILGRAPNAAEQGFWQQALQNEG